MLKPSSNRSIVSKDDRVRYVDGTTCLTIWYDEQKEIIAFEVIFGLVVDEWAFLYHRKGTTDIVRLIMVIIVLTPPKQIMSGVCNIPISKIEVFSIDGDVLLEEKNFVLNIMKEEGVE